MQRHVVAGYGTNTRESSEQLVDPHATPLDLLPHELAVEDGLVLEGVVVH